MDEHSRIAALETELALLRREIMEHRMGGGLSNDVLVSHVLRDRNVLESLPDVVMVLDREHRVLYINRSGLPGRSAESILGTSSLEYMPVGQHPRYIEMFERCWETGLPMNMEIPSIDDFWWESRLVPVRVHGEVMFMLSSSADITKRKRAELELRESELRLRLALDATGMGTWSWNTVSDQLTLDPITCQIFGLPELEGTRRFADFIERLHADDRPCIEAAVARATNSGTCEDMECRIIRPDGELRYILSKGTIIVNDAGEPIGFRGGVFDVTARKRMEEQLTQGQKMEAIGQLTAGIAHNFNNLLSVILPNVSLARFSTGVDLESCLEDIDHAARRAADMVQQLMLFARRSPVAQLRESIDLGATVGRTVQICRTTFDRGIRIELLVDDDVPPVAANAGQIEQVLLNICINARDALELSDKPDPNIVLHVQRTSEGGGRVRIVDNGPGMAEQTRLRVFEPFFTTKEVGRGTGLGLASAYAIVTEHRGRISCTSQLGASTTFLFDLPAATVPVVTAPTERKPLPVSRGSETILLIDDEPLVRRAAAAMLSFGGYHVLEAEGGKEGLEKYAARKSEIALVILDRSMPGLPGEQVAIRLRELEPNVRIVLLSGQAGPAPAAAHAAAVLSKPVDAQMLLGTIRDVLERRVPR